MLAKRIIPCLDIKDGRTVKGVNFENIRDAGDPVELALRYSQEGADELVFLDISATREKRKTLSELVRNIAGCISIPFTVGGGISSLEDVHVLLQNGADKISVNSAAFYNRNLIRDLMRNFGSQCVVAAIDVKKELDNNWYVYTHGGTRKTETRALDWARTVEADGAGEILLTSMNNDGVKSGFATDITAEISIAVGIPVIASGGAGTLAHFEEAFNGGKADAVLAASVFHFREIEIKTLKQFLAVKKIPVRLT